MQKDSHRSASDEGVTDRACLKCSEEGRLCEDACMNLARSEVGKARLQLHPLAGDNFSCSSSSSSSSGTFEPFETSAADALWLEIQEHIPNILHQLAIPATDCNFGK